MDLAIEELKSADENDAFIVLTSEYYEPCPYVEDIDGHVFKYREEPYEDMWVKFLCSRPWCERCAPFRMWRLRQKIHKYLIHNHPSHMWFVTRSVRNERSLKKAFETLHAANQAFDKQKKNDPHHPYHSRVTAWIGTYEITWKYKTGYNLHQHLIIGSEDDRIEYKAVGECWSRAVGYTAQFHMEKIKHGVSGAVGYVSSYISKGYWGGLQREVTFKERLVLKGRNRSTSMRGTIPPSFPLGYYLCCRSDHGNCEHMELNPNLLGNRAPLSEAERESIEKVTVGKVEEKDGVKIMKSLQGSVADSQIQGGWLA